MAERDWESELTAYIDGELSPAEAAAVEAELGRRPELKALERRLRAAVAMVEALPVTEPSTALRRQVLAAVDRPSAWERLRQLFTGPGALVPAGLAVAAGATAVVLWPRDEEVGLTGEQLLLAQNMDVLEDLDLVGLEDPDDLDVIATLHELEIQR